MASILSHRNRNGVGKQLAVEAAVFRGHPRGGQRSSHLRSTTPDKSCDSPLFLLFLTRLRRPTKLRGWVQSALDFTALGRIPARELYLVQDSTKVLTSMNTKPPNDRQCTRRLALTRSRRLVEPAARATGGSASSVQLHSPVEHLLAEQETPC